MQAQFTLAALKTRPESVSLSLSRIGSRMVQVTTLDEPVELRAGSYQLDTLVLRTLAADGIRWEYTFRNTGGELIELAGDDLVAVELLGELAFDLAYTGEARPGEGLSTEGHLRGATGLELTGCNRGTRQDLPGTLTITAPDGGVVEEDQLGFG